MQHDKKQDESNGLENAAASEKKFVALLGILKTVIPSAIILIIGIVVPQLLLVWGWTKEFSDIFNVFAIANKNKEIYQFSLILIPICSVYLTTSLIHVSEDGISAPKFHPIFTFFCFRVPGIFVILLLIMLGHYSQERPTSPFDADKLGEFKAAFWATVICLFLMDAYIALSKEHPGNDLVH